MANSLNVSFTDLGCQHLGLTNPVTVKRNGAGTAVAATFNTAVQTALTEPARDMSIVTRSQTMIFRK